MTRTHDCSFHNLAGLGEDENDEETRLLPPNRKLSPETHTYGSESSFHKGESLSDSFLTGSVTPPCSSESLDHESSDWKIPIDTFSSKKLGDRLKDIPSKEIRSFYKEQDDLISSFEEIYFGLCEGGEDENHALHKIASRLTLISLLLNTVLLGAKLTASVLSGSISIISSLVDSVVDIMSSIVLWWATTATRKRNPYSYPQGRTKLEPLAVVVLSVIMSVASVQLIYESVKILINLIVGSGVLPKFDIPTIVIAASTIATKFILWIICRRVHSPTIQALAQDHRNDVLSNSVAIAFGYLGSQEFMDQTGYKEFVYYDPIGAILIAVYIIFNWWSTGSDQAKVLTGISASPEFLAKLTWLTLNHNPNIKFVKTVQAYHFGNNCLVEVDIVLPKHIHLHTAHDIGETLQRKLETLPEVERAFVHVDYTVCRHPRTEHKSV